MSNSDGFGLHGDWKGWLGLLGGGAVTVAPVGSFAWFAGWLLLAIGLFGLASVVTFNGNAWWRSFRKTGALLATVVLLGLGAIAGAQMRGAELNASTTEAIPSSPSIDDISFELVIQGLDGENVSGYFLLKNPTDETLFITTIQHEVPGKFLSSISDEMPRTISPNGYLSIPLNEPNYLVSARSVRLLFNYRFGTKDGENPAFVQFDIPKVVPGTFKPTLCCQKSVQDIEAVPLREMQTIFLRPEGGLDVGLREVNGSFAMITPSRNRQFLFNPDTREVVFTVTNTGRQKVFHTRLESSYTGQHDVKLRWNDADDFAALWVDGVLSERMR